MPVCTDSPAYGDTLLPAGVTGPFRPCTQIGADPGLLHEILGTDAPLHCADLHDPQLTAWTILARDAAPRSQYDSLIGLARTSALPDRLACVARTGSGFHGFRGRAWTAQPGNIHLTVHLAPHRRVEQLQTVFTVMAAAAVLETIDTLPGLEGAASVKWVNDVLIGDAKVAGVLAYTQTRGDVVTSVILGIGLNVETTPDVARSPWVPGAGSLRAIVADPEAISAGAVLRTLLLSLDRLYEVVLREGNAPLVESYRARSAIIGSTVRILSDDVADAAGAGAPPRVIAEGRVAGIGDGLELYIEGHAEPITRGRLIMGDAAEGAS
jgi:BirA family transcriptional regulator, biotin operon repressor / biotin---[acetyl-CoA-carboxylase] ligase